MYLSTIITAEVDTINLTIIQEYSQFDHHKNGHWEDRPSGGVMDQWSYKG